MNPFFWETFKGNVTFLISHASGKPSVGFEMSERLKDVHELKTESTTKYLKKWINNFSYYFDRPISEKTFYSIFEKKKLNNKLEFFYFIYFGMIQRDVILSIFASLAGSQCKFNQDFQNESGKMSAVKKIDHDWAFHRFQPKAYSNYTPTFKFVIFWIPANGRTLAKVAQQPKEHSRDPIIYLFNSCPLEENRRNPFPIHVLCMNLSS